VPLVSSLVSSCISQIVPATPLVSSLRKVCKARFLSGTDKIYTPRTRKISSQDEIISFNTKGVEKTELNTCIRISCTLLYLSSSVFVFLYKSLATPLVSSLRKAKQSVVFIHRIKFAAAYQKSFALAKLFRLIPEVLKKLN
jgi:hypothetical protein